MNPLDLRPTAAGRSNASLHRSTSTLIQKKPPLPYSPLGWKTVACLGLSRWGISWAHKCQWHRAEESDCLVVTIWLRHHKNITDSLQETVKMDKCNIGPFPAIKEMCHSVSTFKRNITFAHTHQFAVIKHFSLSVSLFVFLSFSFLNLGSLLSVGKENEASVVSQLLFVLSYSFTVLRQMTGYIHLLLLFIHFILLLLLLILRLRICAV